MLKASLYLDTRRSLKDGKYPLKLHVLERSNLRTYYPLGESLTEKEWEAIKSRKVRAPELRGALSRILDFESRARTIIKSDPYLTLKQFDALFTGRTKLSPMVKDLYDEKIKDLLKRGQYLYCPAYSGNHALARGSQPGLHKGCAGSLKHPDDRKLSIVAQLGRTT